MYGTCCWSRAGNSLIRSSLICSFCSNQMSYCERFAQIAQDKWATVSESLRLLKTNERLWVNHSGRSWQMSDRERFAQVAHDKWANERFAQKNLKSYFLVCFIKVFFISKYEQFAHSLIFGEWCERIAQVAYQKWAMWANHSGRSPKMSEWSNHSFFWANRSFAHFFAKNKRFARKIDVQIPSPVLKIKHKKCIKKNTKCIHTM